MKTFPLTVIIPVHELNAETTVLLKEAVESVYAQKEYKPSFLTFVVPETASEMIKVIIGIGEAAQEAAASELKFSIAENVGATDIATQVNAGLAEVGKNSPEHGEYVTILELDDQLADNYVAEMAAHAAEMPEVDGWLPLAVSVDVSKRLLKYENVAVWVPKTEAERPDGFVDAETTEVAPDLLLSGAMLKTETYTDGYGLKPSIGLAFVNEFYRRIVGRGAVLRGMGKVLYMHTELRPGSYNYECLMGEGKYSASEVAACLEMARTESAFEVERELQAAN